MVVSIFSFIICGRAEFQSHRYDEEIEGFSHLICSNLCTKNCVLYPERCCSCLCPHNHMASRRTSYFVQSGPNPLLVDFAAETENMT